MERKPRRHERLTIYKRMLKDFQADVHYVYLQGLCKQLMRYSKDLKRSSYISDYPELLEYKPANILGNYCYWWPIFGDSGRTERIRVLKSVIKKMESKVAK